MSDWNSAQYLKFQNERTRPAADLAARVTNSPKTAVDIGCGPGNSTRVLREALPEADILGIDSSPNMIEKAKAQLPGTAFRLCDALSLEGTYDLLFSNACLQWIPDHAALLPALMDKLNEGGILAAQMPMNGEEPLFRLIREVAQEPAWGLAQVPLQPNETLTPPEYYDILSGCASAFDMWETTYYHTLPNHQALVDWVKGSRLRPYLDFLGPQRGAELVRELTARAETRYPVMGNDCVVLRFRRFFFTAVK